MEQEKPENEFFQIQEAEMIDREVEIEAEPEKEKSKKILIIFIALLLLGCTYYYYAKSNTGKVISDSGIKTQIQDKKNILPISDKKAFRELAKIQKIENIAKKVTEVSVPDKVADKKIKPTDRSTLLSLAEKSSGKHDPFSYSESRFIPFTSEGGGNSITSFPGGLPPVPGSGMGNLPSLPGLPGTISSSGLAQPPAPKPEDLIIVKGFIGNKVIVEIDGVVEALSENEKVDNTKVLLVNRPALTAKFEINGKPFIKTLKSLTNDYEGNIQLVKNLHN